VADHGFETAFTDGLFTLVSGLLLTFCATPPRMQAEPMGLEHLLTHGITAGELGTMQGYDLGKAIIRDVILLTQPFEADGFTTLLWRAQLQGDLIACRTEGGGE
jgi:hypothetical protein